MFFLRKFLYAICLNRTEKKYRYAKNRSLNNYMHGGVLGVGRLARWWTRKMPLFLGGADDRRPRLKLRKLELAVRNYGTFENFIAKSLAGFTFGVMLTYGLYFLFVFPLNFSFAGATLWCVIIGFISTLGLAFSEYFRSIALLSLPSFFSSKGRQALTTYAIILAVTGPGKNSLNNVRVLSDSIGCSQERVRKSLRDVFYLTKNPYVAIKQSLSVVISRVMEIAKKIKAITSAIKKQVLTMDEVLIMASKSLEKVSALCQNKNRHPYDTCIRSINAASEDCKVSLNCAFGGLCKSDHLSRSICSHFGVVESICASPSDTSNLIANRVQMKLTAFVRRLHNLLSFKLTKSHESHYELRKSRQVKDVVNAIATDIRELTGSILYLFDSISILFSFFYIYLFYSVITFRNKYLAHEWYENRYITSNLLLIEMKRVRQKKTTIFPLSRIESQKYIKINSLNLGTMDVYEMYNMIIKAVALFIKMSLHMAADYGLWWLIMECRRAANHVQVPEGMSNIEVQTCKADGLSGQIYNEIANAFQPTLFNFTTDMTSCLPEPSAPDVKRNVTIMLIGVITVIIGFVEPYGRRLKVCIMNFYYPIIARRRAVWLYNHILRTRNTFTRGARRRLRRQYGRWDRKEPEAATFLYRFRCEYGRKLPFVALRKVVTPKDNYNRCILCKAFGAPDDPLTTCATQGCKGTYCLECFANLQNLCTICLEPIEYNDVSDVSEEKDSSEEEKQLRKEWVAKMTPGVFELSSDSDAASVGSDDFEPKCVIHPVNVELCDMEDHPITPEAFTVLDDKEKDWATLQDFELPKGEQAQYAIAEQGIAMTLSHRIRTGFSGLIFAKPVFGRAVEPGHVHDLERALSADHLNFDTNLHDDFANENLLRKPTTLRRKLGNVPKKLMKFAKRRLSRSPSTRSRNELSRASTSKYDSGSGSASKRSPAEHLSNFSTTLSEQQENVRTLGRGFKRSDRLLQVYYGLHMSKSKYKKVGRSSGSENEERSQDSGDYDMKATKSLYWSQGKTHSLDESTRPHDTVTSHHYESSSSYGQLNTPSKGEATTTDIQTGQTDGKEYYSELSESSHGAYRVSTVPARPSFRDIKVQPTKSQVTHQMFHVDDSE